MLLGSGAFDAWVVYGSHRLEKENKLEMVMCIILMSNMPNGLFAGVQSLQ